LGDAKRKAERALISVLIPERGRPEMLNRLVYSLFEKAADDRRFEVLVAIDEDDPAWHRDSLDRQLGHWALSSQAKVEVGPRPKTLGEKLNILAAKASGDILWFIANDYEMLTEGWPRIVREAVAKFPGGLGIAFPKDSLHPDHASFPIMTRTMYEASKMFAPPWFPYWYVDTWWDEVGLMLGVRPEIAVEVSAPEGRGTPQGLRDVTFWATFFDRMRPFRMRDARGLAWAVWGKDSERTRQMEAMIESRAAFCAARNGHLVTPEFAAIWEGKRDGTPTPEYDKVKAYAAAMLDNIVPQERQAKPVRVAVAVPSGRSCEAGTMTSIAGLMAYSSGYQDLELMLINLQMSTISMARNNIVQRALDNGCDYILWIDGDMKVPADTLLRLLQCGKEIIGATYCKRVARDDGTHETLGRFAPVVEGHEYDDPREATLLPGGVMLVKADVYRALSWPWYADVFRWAPDKDGLAAFKEMVRESLLAPPSEDVLASLDGSVFGEWLADGYNVSSINYNSEDYFFCVKARRAGFTVWCSLSLTNEVIHLGEYEVTCRMPDGALKLAAE